MENHMNQVWLRRSAIGASLAALVGVASWAFAAPSTTKDVDHPKIYKDSDVSEAKHKASELSRAFSHAADVVRPAVVSIQSTKTVKTDDGPAAGNDLLRRFFEEQPELRGREPHRQHAPRAPEQQGLGSGFIVSQDGYILTNNHVAGDADRLTVKLHDGSTHKAKLIGKDETTDLAVIKIDGKNLPTVQFGDSNQLEAGEWVLALGAPFGLSDTLTVGVVSATKRSNVNLSHFENYIQTDAAINPGNSGGPLINLDGEVIGINTAIASNTGGFMGIGFAIPSDMAHSIMDKLIAHGKVMHGMLGVVVQPLDQDLASSFGYEGTGTLVSQVMPDSPAKSAGLVAGDIITKVDGKSITEPNDLRNLVAMSEPGSSLQLDVVRKGEAMTVTAKVGELPSKGGQAGGGGAEKATDALGLGLRTLSESMAGELGLDADTHGVLVESVEGDSPASRAGLREGDVILEVQDQPIKDVGQFSAELKKHDLDKGVRLLIQTGNGRHYVVLKQGD
jgi:serine protease Do